MQIRIAEIRVGYEGREDRYFVMYPPPAPEAGPDWMILDADGGPVCVDETADKLRDELPEEFVDALCEAARAAVERRAGESLEERLTIPGDSAFEWAEDLGWLVRYGPGVGEVILANTPVLFPDGLPAGLRDRAGGDISRAMRLLADAVRQDEAELLLPGVPPSRPGEILTAAELAAAQ